MINSSTSEARNLDLSPAPWSVTAIRRRAVRGLAWGAGGAALGTAVLLLTADFETGNALTRGGLMPLTGLWVIWALLPLSCAWACVLEPLTATRGYGALAGILAVTPLIVLGLVSGSGVPWQRSLTMVVFLAGGALFGATWRDFAGDRVPRGDA